MSLIALVVWRERLPIHVHRPASRHRGKRTLQIDDDCHVDGATIAAAVVTRVERASAVEAFSGGPSDRLRVLATFLPPRVLPSL